MKAKKAITTLKDRIGHLLKGHLTEILTWVNSLKFKKFRKLSDTSHEHKF